jgi:hypothetical protein
MGNNVVLAGLELYGKGFPHTSVDNLHYEVDSTGKVVAIDCSMLVYQALLNAGYGSVLPNSLSPSKNSPGFSTATWFNNKTQSLTPAAKNNKNFVDFTPSDVKNGLLKPGDIILFERQSDNVLHMGIFTGYDKQGDPMFYGAQNSHGTAIVDATKGSYWNGGTYDIVAALRPQNSTYNASGDITQSLQQSTGAGLTIPGQANDPNATYTCGCRR